MRPLQHPAFRLLLAGRAAAMLGNAIAPIALAFAVLDLTGSVASLGIVVGARSAANVLFLLFGGVVADRFPRAVVLGVSSAGSAATQAAVAALVLTGAATVPTLAALSAVNGMVSAFTFPASAALAPQTVPPHLLREANAVLRLGVNGAMLSGASLGGLLVAFAGPGWGLAADAATFAVAGLCFARIRVPGVAVRAGGDHGTLRDLREGWSAFVAHRWVWVVVLAFTFINAAVVAGVQVLGPAVADQTVGRAAWGVVLAAQTAGLIAGAVLALRLRVRRLLLFGCACMGLEVLLPLMLAVRPTVVPLMAVAFLGGVAIEQFGVAWETSLGEHIPADRLARVYSYDAIGSFVAIPVAEVAVGPVAEAIGTDATLYATVAVVALGTTAMVASRSVRGLQTGQASPSRADSQPIDSTSIDRP